MPFINVKMTPGPTAEQKAAFIFTAEEILTEIRPIHDSLFQAEAGYDPLAVLLHLSSQIMIFLLSYFRTRSPIISALDQELTNLTLKKRTVAESGALEREPSAVACI